MKDKAQKLHPIVPEPVSNIIRKIMIMITKVIKRDEISEKETETEESR